MFLLWIFVNLVYSSVGFVLYLGVEVLLYLAGRLLGVLLCCWVWITVLILYFACNAVVGCVVGVLLFTWRLLFMFVIVLMLLCV